MGIEKRRFKRLPLRGFLECVADFDMKNAHLENIPVLSLSAGGMFIAVQEDQIEALEQGELLNRIRLDLPELETVLLKGTIAHRMSLGEIGGCGVEFHDVEETDSIVLDEFVHRKLKEFGLFSG